MEYCFYIERLGFGYVYRAHDEELSKSRPEMVEFLVRQFNYNCVDADAICQRIEEEEIHGMYIPITLPR